MPINRTPGRKLASVVALLGLGLLACNLPTTGTDTPAPPPTSPEPPVDMPEQPSATSQPILAGTNVTLGANLCFDFDGGMEVDCSDPGADIKFEVVETASTQSWTIIALGSTQLRTLGMGYQGELPPSESECAFEPGASNILDLLPSAEFFWNCFQTGEGLLGWLKAHSWVPGILTFSWASIPAPPGILYTPVPWPEGLNQQ